MFCLTPTIDSILAALVVANRRQPLSGLRRPELRSISGGIIPLNLSQNSYQGEPDRDWFAVGRDSARQLKIELGIERNSDSDAGAKIGDGGSTFEINKASMESGRAAARELLNEITAEQHALGLDCGFKSSSLLKSLDDESSQAQSGSYFNMPSRKSHCMTICLVPPPSATKVWERLTAIRGECKDPGFYRWPPHANILYPFLVPAYKEDDGESKDSQKIKFRNEVATHLSKAVMKCDPFDVTISSFGTFGGKQRGVMWAYPMSKCVQPRENDEEPLIHLHNMLEQQFPICNDLRKTGAFHPHMTISHYATNADALAAKEKIESGWKSVSFRAQEIYLLEREGDDGQFKIVATISLGVDSAVEFHDPSIPFPAMPEVEEEWVLEERTAMKNRRKDSNKRRCREGGWGKQLNVKQDLRNEGS